MDRKDIPHETRLLAEELELCRHGPLLATIRGTIRKRIDKLMSALPPDTAFSSTAPNERNELAGHGFIRSAMPLIERLLATPSGERADVALLDDLIGPLITGATLLEGLVLLRPLPENSAKCRATAQQVADYIGIGSKAAREWIKDGKIAAVSVGGGTYEFSLPELTFHRAAQERAKTRKH